MPHFCFGNEAFVYQNPLLSSSPRNFNRRFISFQTFITCEDFNFIT